MEYLPKTRRGRVAIPFGYYVCPIDPTILIPDPKKIEAIHYAFRMRSKYNTPIRDCTQWLHAATGQRMSPGGFFGAYNTWIKKLKKEKKFEIAAKRKAMLQEQKKFVEDNFKQFGISINDRDDITALAHNEAKTSWKKREQSAN